MAGKLWCYVSYVVLVKMINHMITLLDPMVCQATDFRRCFVEHRTVVFVEVKFYISPATWQAKLHRTLLKLMFWQLTRSIAGARTTTEQPFVWPCDQQVRWTWAIFTTVCSTQQSWDDLLEPHYPRQWSLKFLTFLTNATMEHFCSILWRTEEKNLPDCLF